VAARYDRRPPLDLYRAKNCDSRFADKQTRFGSIERRKGDGSLFSGCQGQVRYGTRSSGATQPLPGGFGRPDRTVFRSGRRPFRSRFRPAVRANGVPRLRYPERNEAAVGASRAATSRRQSKKVKYGISFRHRNYRRPGGSHDSVPFRANIRPRRFTCLGMETWNAVR
jgi:hypothetical protein